MTTINKELSLFRQIIKEVSDDTKYTDPELYDVWNKARVKILRQDISKTGLLSPWNNTRFCIRLNVAKSHNCDCVAVGCDIRKSEYKVPKPIADKYIGAIEVTDMFGNIIGYSTEADIKTAQLDEIKRGRPRWSLYNGHLILWNKLDTDAVQVNGPWEDLLDWQDIQYCTESNPCVDIFSIDLGVNEDRAKAILEEARDMLLQTKQIIDDWTSEGNPERRI